MDQIHNSTKDICSGKISHNSQNKKFIRHPGKSNLTSQQLKIIQSLKTNPDIIIKPADKGGATVILSSQLYKNEAIRQLSNTNYYIPISEPIYPDTAEKIIPILQDLLSHKYISRKQFQYLHPAYETINSRYFYLLPKIHKKREAWPHPFCPPGRPIVADVSTESSRICAYIDHFLQPLSILHPAYIKDTYHFVNKVRNQQVPPDSLLITADVESLYTNMNLDLIIQSIEEIFDSYHNPWRPDKFILDLLKLTLYNNDFEFDNQFYLQICGIAMGRRYAPSCANIYLKKFDTLAMKTYKITPLLYSRFLDDIFGIWPGTIEQLKQYESYLNSLIPGIKVTFNYNQDIIEFLDTYIYKYHDPNGNCFLRTKVHFKTTDTHQLLHRNSFHPHHTFNSVVKSQFIRFKRICSTFEDFQVASSILIKALRARGYSLTKLIKTKRDVWHNYTEKSPHQKIQEKNTELIPVITYYDRHHSRLNQKWAEIIKSNQRIKQAPQNKNIRVISCYKKHRNLRQILTAGRYKNPDQSESLLTALAEVLAREEQQDLLCRTRFPDPRHSSQNPPVTIPNGPNSGQAKRCTNIKCKACNYILESHSFTSSVTQKRFPLYENFTCHSSKVIYLITCAFCQKQYVGETSRPLSHRITDHISAINLKKSTPVGIHFNSSSHALKHFSIIPIHSVPIQQERRKIELIWQNILSTHHPKGFNDLNLNRC